MDEWNHVKLDAENGRHNMIIYEGLVCHSHRADSGVIVMLDDMELKKQLCMTIITHLHWVIWVHIMRLEACQVATVGGACILIVRTITKSA